MKKRKIILLTGVIILFLVIGLLILLLAWPQEHRKYFDNQFQDCIDQNQENYLMLMAQRTGDESYCEQKQLAKEQCLAFARKNPDPYCAGIQSEEYKPSCYAEVLGDPSKCPENNTWCLAYASGDPSYCEQLEEFNIEECKNLLPQNAEYWISKEKTQNCKDIGFLDAVSRTKDKKLCDKVSERSKEACLRLAE
jgi:hypothetical protein